MKAVLHTVKPKPTPFELAWVFLMPCKEPQHIDAQLDFFWMIMVLRPQYVFPLLLSYGVNYLKTNFIPPNFPIMKCC